MTESIKMIEIFSGIGAQAKALDNLPIPHEVVATMDVDKEAIVSYASMRYDLEKEASNYEFPSKEVMVSELQSKNVGFDFAKSKHSITMKTNIDKVKLYYLSDKLSKNLGDVSLQKELPYVDIIFHSSPCQDYSVAGKGAGGDEGSETRSSLMWESLRLIGTSMPRFIVWENVAAVLSGKHRHNFIKYLERLSEMGYESAFDLLNSKNFGVPQNRLRIFCVSHRIDDTKSTDITPYEYKGSNKQVKDTLKEISTNDKINLWSTFAFPESIPLTTRLKDILEHNVDEKYYLPDDRIEKILNSSFTQEKKRIQTTDVCDTLLARDWKDPKCVPVEEDVPNLFNEIKTGLNEAIKYEKSNEEPQVKQIGNVCPTKTRSNPNQGRVYDKDGIAPALTTMKGGNREPMVIDEIRVVGNYMPSNHDASRVVDVDGIAPTVKENHGTVTAIAEPFIVASRGRNPDNPSDRTTGAPTEQRLEPNFNGITNCLTSVAKDNYVAEPIIYDDYNSRIPQDQDAITTLTTNCGASAERNGVKIIEPTIIDEKVAIVEDQFPGSRDARIYKEYSPSLRTNCSGLQVAKGEEEQPRIRWRIRKLSEKECWRLMGFTDEDHDRAAKYTSASARYKQAGNSICTCCLISIFSSLFLEGGYKSDIWTKYSLNYDD